jgi:hypothetical protein
MFSIGKLLKSLLGHWHLAAALSVALVVSIVFWETSRAVHQARDRVDSESLIRFTVETLDRAAPSSVEAIAAPSMFRDAAKFNGHLFVAGPHGLVEYDTNGALVRRFRPGLELPPAPVVSLAVGVLAAGSEPELLIATAGEGLLRFDGQHMRLVRAERPEHRKLTAALWLGAGRLLLGTDKAGVFVYDGRQLTPAHPGLANVSVTALAGADGDVWIGTLDRGVLHWRGGEIDRFDESAGLPDVRVLSLAARGERAYVGTAVGVAEFRNGWYVRALGTGLFAVALAIRHDTLIVGTLDATVA